MTPETEKQTFVTEQTKKKPVNKKRLLEKVGTAALCGLVFALFLLGVLAIGLPIVLRHVRQEIAVADSEAALSFGEGEQSEIAGSEEAEPDTSETEGTELSSSEDPDAAGIQALDGAEQKQLTLEEYQDLRTELYTLGKSFEKYLVTVTGITDETDWLANHYEKKGMGAGVIISETEGEYLILTLGSALKTDGRILVTAEGGAQCEGTLIAEDVNTGFAVVSITKADLDPGTRGRICVAQLGNSHRVRNGQIVLALGNPLGSSRAVLIGSLIATGSEKNYEDRNYSLLTTDLPASKNSNGILIDIDGDVIGLLLAGSQAENEGSLTAISISDMEGILRLLINGNRIPYAGMYLMDVTRAMEEEYGIHSGVYIREVTMDSPAMLAGLQSGDVITQVAGMPVNTNAGFQQQLLNYEIGSVCEITVQRIGQEGYDEVVCDLTIGSKE